MSNILQALLTIHSSPVENLTSFYRSRNRINLAGDTLEHYIKYIFSNTLNETDAIRIQEIQAQVFSYLGNQNNPPDLILRNGDALEIKKIESTSSDLALNSSYPKNKLFHNDTRITNACRNCESVHWIEKDLIYTIGYIPKTSNQIKILWFVYGICYAAEREIYSRIQHKISDGIQELEGIEFHETNEIAKVKKVDPLGITDLRVRGMWHIKNPIKVFENFFSNYDPLKMTVVALMPLTKYESFPAVDRAALETHSSISQETIRIQSPSNPANLFDAKLIHFSI